MLMWILGFGLLWSSFLVGIRLDGGDMSFGGCLTMLFLSEFIVFSTAFSQCFLSECLDPTFRTVFTSGFITRVRSLCPQLPVMTPVLAQVTWLLPPIAISELMLMIEIEHKDKTSQSSLSWHTIFTPWLFAMFLWLAGETLCYPCCEEKDEGPAFGQMEDMEAQEDEADMEEAQAGDADGLVVHLDSKHDV